MLISDLAQFTISRLATVAETSSVCDAANVFADGRLGLIIVCDAAGGAVGVVSKSDFVRYLARRGDVEAPVSGIMTASVTTASPADELRSTWELMTRQRLQNLPLLAPDRRPIGTLDIRDALKAILEAEEAQETHLINYIAGYGYH
jgi:CBS domain-containing protein